MSRRRRPHRVLAAAITAAVMLVAPSVAGAHELGLVVVAARDEAGSAAADGFRLAVDQSPDVSHAPGTDAGDHLGGIDVDVVRVPGNLRASDVSRRVARAAARGARLVVVLPPAGAARQIVLGLGADGPLVVVAGRRSDLPGRPALPVVLLTGRAAGGADRARRERFERAFARRHGRRADAPARVGYDAGRLLDGVLSRLGEGPFDEPALQQAVARAAPSLQATTATVVPASVQDAELQPPSADADRSYAVPLGILAVALVAVSFVVLRRRSGASRAGPHVTSVGERDRRDSNPRTPA